jgi:hypothetical protein
MKLEDLDEKDLLGFSSGRVSGVWRKGVQQGLCGVEEFDKTATAVFR